MTLTDFLHSNGYKKIERSFEWQDCTAHSIDLGSGCVGVPVFVLEKDNNFRLALGEEALEIFHRECELFYPDDDE